MTTVVPTQAPAGAARPSGAGGRRLASAFDAVSRIPALAEARRRLIVLAEQPNASAAEMAAVVEDDAGLAFAVMQAANNGSGPRGRVASVPAAVEVLDAERLSAIATRIASYDPLGPSGAGGERFERFRRHAVAVRTAADRVGDVARIEARDELAAAALLHDVGRLVLGELYGSEFGVGAPGPDDPGERLHHERRELGIDHALVGAVLIRRWGLPAPIASAVERHHASDASGLAGAVQLADLVVHSADGRGISGDTLRDAAGRVGIDDEALRALLFEFPHAGGSRPRATEPCPLSSREVDALRGLAAGKVYKQIAQELSLSVSTIRTHLHNVYGKIGAVDRAQAVLIARERGWI